MKGAERQASFKARNSVFNAKATNVSLAVFPYQIEFTSNLDYTSAFYFEKDLQIIGTLNQQIPSHRQHTSIPLRAIDNLIKFRIYTFHNMNYKWSQYRIYETGEQEFLESASIDLRTSLGELTPLSNIDSFRSHESYMLPCNIEKELQVKLQKTGVIIKFLLLICEDEKQLEQSVKDRFFGRLETKKQDKVEQSPVNQEHIKNGDGFKAVELDGKQDVQQQYKNSKEAPKQGYLLDLDALILEEGENKTVNQPEQTKKAQNKDQDLCFGVQKPKVSQAENEQSKAVKNPEKEEKKTNVRDYSLLKLQSDQGRLKMDSIDRKLELEQLEMIEQEGVSPSSRLEEGANQESQKQVTALPLQTASKHSNFQSVATFSRQHKFKLSVGLLIVIMALLGFFVFPHEAKLGRKTKSRKVTKK